VLRLRTHFTVAVSFSHRRLCVFERLQRGQNPSSVSYSRLRRPPSCLLLHLLHHPPPLLLLLLPTPAPSCGLPAPTPICVPAPLSRSFKCHNRFLDMLSSIQSSLPPLHTPTASSSSSFPSWCPPTPSSAASSGPPPVGIPAPPPASSCVHLPTSVPPDLSYLRHHFCSMTSTCDVIMASTEEAKPLLRSGEDDVETALAGGAGGVGGSSSAGSGRVRRMPMSLATADLVDPAHLTTVLGRCGCGGAAPPRRKR